MSRQKILLVEDENDLLELLKRKLTDAGFEVFLSQEGYDALQIAKKVLPDLIILDLLIPGMHGFDVCKELKRNALTRHIPVIILTALGEEMDRVVGLEIGADDYVVKPFSLRELVLRVRAVLRRFDPETKLSSLWQKDGLRIDFEAPKVSVDDREVFLTVTELKLLTELIRNQGRVQTRDQLLDRVWGYHFEGYARTVDTHVRRLRQKLGPYAAWVETVHGTGYRFRE